MTFSFLVRVVGSVSTRNKLQCPMKWWRSIENVEVRGRRACCPLPRPPYRVRRWFVMPLPISQPTRTLSMNVRPIDLEHKLTKAKIERTKTSKTPLYYHSRWFSLSERGGEWNFVTSALMICIDDCESTDSGQMINRKVPVSVKVHGQCPQSSFGYYIQISGEIWIVPTVKLAILYLDIPKYK